MTERELKEEKKELIELLYQKIDSVKSNNDLKTIYELVVKMNDVFDMHDSKFENLFDAITGCFKSNIKSKIKDKIRDLFDKYDKKNKDGSFIYSDLERNQLKEMIKRIDEICNKNFWDRFVDVLRMGS